VQPVGALQLATTTVTTTALVTLLVFFTTVLPNPAFYGATCLLWELKYSLGTGCTAAVSTWHVEEQRPDKCDRASGRGRGLVEGPT